MDCSPHQTPLSTGFSRQKYWSGLPFPFPRDLPNPGIEPRSPTLQADSLPSEPPGKPVSSLPISPFSFPLSFLFGTLAHFPQGFPFFHIILSSSYDLIFTESITPANKPIRAAPNVKTQAKHTFIPLFFSSQPGFMGEEPVSKVSVFSSFHTFHWF